MKNKTKVTFSSYDSLHNPYYGGGGAISTHTICKYLSKDYEVRVVCGKYENCKDKYIDGVYYKYIGFSSHNYKLDQLLFNLFVIREVLFVRKYDIWFENFSAPHSTNMLQLFTYKPIIGVASTLHAEMFSKKYKLPFYLIEKIGLRTYKDIILLSESLVSKVQKLSKANIYVIPRGIDKRYVDLVPKYENYILFIGRIDIYTKGLDLLLNAIKKLAIRKININLVIAGRGLKEEEETLNKQISNLEISKYVSLIGKVIGEEKTKIINNCLLGVMPSRFETFGNTALEFFAFGKSVIVFNIEGLKWTPTNLAPKVPAYNSSLLANVIEKNIKDKDKIIKTGKLAKIFAKRYEWPKIVSQYVDIIESKTVFK